jgi:hypothetical protein
MVGGCGIALSRGPFQPRMGAIFPASWNLVMASQLARLTNFR